MRVALLQIRQDAKSRAASIQSMTAAIDQAARRAPAPDLLILPGACDTGGGPTGRKLTEALLQTVSETIASKAREWGVYIAAGLHVCRADTFYPCAVLFDPDGDRVAWSRPASTARPEQTGEQIQIWPCAIGNLGVIEASLFPLSRNCEAARIRGALIAWPRASAATAKRRQTEDANLAMLRDVSFTRWGAHWGVVAAAGSPATQAEDGPATFVCAPEGDLLASAQHADEAIICADVPIEPAPGNGQTRGYGRDGHAD